MMAGKLFLIPTYLDGSNDASFIAPMVGDVIKNIDYFLVENVRTARRYLSDLKLGLDISALQFEVLDKRSSPEQLSKLMSPIMEGKDVGLLSEAGLPCLADPGNLAVSWMQKNSHQVVPMPGTSSIQLALIASGFNGQQFTFHGYLPIDQRERERKLKELEQSVLKTGYSQIFMETPFRNNQLMKSMMNTLQSSTMLSVASNITGKDEFIKTRSIKEWKKSTPDIHKIPTVFVLGTFPS